MEKEIILRILRENLIEMKEKYGIKKIGIFGSAVRGDMDEESDIDIIVEFSPDRISYKTFGGLANFLEKILNRKVDILTTTGLQHIRYKTVKESIKKDIEFV